MQYLQTLDTVLFTWINSGISLRFDLPFLDKSMQLVTLLGDQWLAWPLLFIFCVGIFLGIRTTWANSPQNIYSRMNFSMRLFLLLALVYGVNAGVYLSIKKAVNRPRPFEQNQVELRVSNDESESLSHNGSFPSGHTANAFMLATILSVLLKRYRYVFYLIALMVALSRVYLGVHFPSDVLAGALLGWLITRLILSLQWLRKILRI